MDKTRKQPNTSSFSFSSLEEEDNNYYFKPTPPDLQCEERSQFEGNFFKRSNHL